MWLALPGFLILTQYCLISRWYRFEPWAAFQVWCIGITYAVPGTKNNFSVTRSVTSVFVVFHTGVAGHQWRTEGGFSPPPPKFQNFDKAEPNSQFRGKYIRNNLIRIPVSLICKLNRTPDFGTTARRSPFSLPRVFNWICWTPPPPKKNPGYATARH
jgi:hypothetical protein